MNAHQQRVLQSFRRVHAWLVANAHYTESAPALGKQREALHDIVQRLTDNATMQSTQQAQTLLVSQDEIEKRREVLSYQMAPIAQVARALRGTVPGIGVLSMPRWNSPTPSVVTAAMAMARKAEIYEDVLIENGLPTDFIAQLEASAAALKDSFDARGMARGARASATRGVAVDLALGRRVVALIDAVLARPRNLEPAKMAEWEQLKRVTVKGTVARRSVELLHSSSSPVQISSSELHGRSTAGTRVA
jgi:hypothetical protein